MLMMCVACRQCKDTRTQKLRLEVGFGGASVGGASNSGLRSSKLVSLFRGERRPGRDNTGHGGSAVRSIGGRPCGRMKSSGPSVGEVEWLADGVSCGLLSGLGFAIATFERRAVA